MAAVTSARARRSLVGMLVAACTATPKARKRAAAVIAGVREHMTTVAAFAAVDYGVWHLSPGAGWIAGGVSLLLLDWKITG